MDSHTSVLLLDLDAETPCFQPISMSIKRALPALAVAAVDVLIALGWRGVADVISAHMSLLYNPGVQESGLKSYAPSPCQQGLKLLNLWLKGMV